MIKKRLTTLFDTSAEMPRSFLYNDLIGAVLKKVLPLDPLQDTLSELEEGLLPIVKWEEWKEGHFSIFLLCRTRLNVGKFFFDMISRWLLPGRHLEISSSFTTDFRLTNDEDAASYTLAEIAFSVENEDTDMVRLHLPILEAELHLGVISSYHASRILEIKGLSADEKTSLIQEGIASLVRRRPRDFDYDIFSQMQHFLVMCRDEFKVAREYRHMTRLITLFYQFSKALRKHIESEPHKRHLLLKLFKTRLHVPLGIKRVLALSVGMNFLKENEIFEERHLLTALRHHIPSACLIEDSFLVHESREDTIHLVYVEVMKEDGSDFSLDEIRMLRTLLPGDLKNHVEHLLRPLFMPRNEEEIMRHIVTLSYQLKYTRDLPQVIISFDAQTHSELSFTVIILRLLQEDAPSIYQLFKATETSAKTTMTFVPDRVKRVGFLRNRYPKEATVFRLKFSSGSFLRDDHSVDLYKARQAVIAELNRAIGEVRDFNGGMIAKQIEVFLAFKNELGFIGEQNEFLLENFFHSLFPVEARSMMSAEPLKTLFLMLLASRGSAGKPILFKRENDRFFVMTTPSDSYLKQRILDVIAALNLPSSQLVTLHFEDHLGYIYFCDEEAKQEAFLRPLASVFDEILLS